jgi:uncharacterized membrane protein
VAIPSPILDRHFTLPAVARLDALRPLKWLKLGWDDLRWNPVPSLLYGLLLAIWGLALLTWAAPFPHLVTVAVSGFFLVAPWLMAGLYAMSEAREHGRRLGLQESFARVRRRPQALDLYAALMVFGVLCWERISAIVFALFYEGQAPDLANVVGSLFLSGDFVRLTVVWVLAGFVLAAWAFAVSAFSVPMMVHRDVDTITAMVASARAVAANLCAMTVWSALIVALTALGFATGMLGFVVVVPLLGHATWHAYRDTLC